MDASTFRRQMSGARVKLTGKWEHNCHGEGRDILRLTENTRIIRMGSRDPLYSAEQWGDYSLRYPLRGPWCRTLAEARRTMPAPLREAHTMAPEESLRFAISLILDRHFNGRLPEGMDRLAGYLQCQRSNDATVPKMTRAIREAWEAFADEPLPRTCDDIAASLLHTAKDLCARRGFHFEELTPETLDALERAW